MKLQKIANLIQVRDYVYRSIENPTIDRATSNQLNNMLIMIDKKIIAAVVSDDFKAQIEFDKADKVIAGVIKEKNAVFAEAQLLKINKGDTAVVATPGNQQKAQEVKFK